MKVGLSLHALEHHNLPGKPTPVATRFLYTTLPWRTKREGGKRFHLERIVPGGKSQL